MKEIKQMTYIVYHTQSEIVNIMLSLHKNIKGKHSMKQDKWKQGKYEKFM